MCAQWRVVGAVNLRCYPERSEWVPVPRFFSGFLYLTFIG
jgi:hypothetical protein